MKVSNRVKVNASISAAGVIEFGTPLPGYQGLVLAESTGDRFPYLLKSGDGSQFESGYFVQALEYPFEASREVEFSNVEGVRTGGLLGFADSTTGLVFHGVVGAPQLLAGSGSEGASATSWMATAAGHLAHAKHLQSMALGCRMQTTMPGEFAFGRGERGASSSVVDISCWATADSSAGFTVGPGDTTPMIFGGALLGVDMNDSSPLLGLYRVEGTIMVMDGADWSPYPGNCQVYDVSMVMSQGSGVLVDFSVTPMVTAGLTEHTIALDFQDQLTLTNTSAGVDMWAIGQLRFTRIVTASEAEAGY